MKKNSTCRQSPRRGSKARQQAMTIGMDLGDKTSRYCVLDEQGEVVEEQSVATTKKGMLRVFGARRQECEEACDRSGGAEAGNFAAPFVGDRRSV